MKKKTSRRDVSTGPVSGEVSHHSICFLVFPYRKSKGEEETHEVSEMRVAGDYDDGADRKKRT